jgi:NDP-sugar pyrophosphorylase family protein
MGGLSGMIKKAVILAAGKGTRMKDLTADMPKPMLRVNGVPVLERIVKNLSAAGIRDLLIITGYKADVVEEHFGDGRAFDSAIRYARQETQDGTGKVVELGRAFVGSDPFLLVYGDILVEPGTYERMVEEFQSRKGCAGIISVNLGEDVTKGGVLIFDDTFRLKELIEKPSAEQLQQLKRTPGFKPWYNAGLYAFTAELFGHIARLKKSVRGEYELTDAIRTLAQETGGVYGMQIKGYWIDVRGPELLAKAQSLVR